MDNAVRRVFLSWGLLVLPFITLAQSIEVEIRRASEISRDPAIVEAQRLVGDVLLRDRQGPARPAWHRVYAPCREGVSRRSCLARPLFLT